MEYPLKGKSVLFFAPAFFDYEKMIANKIVELGGKVDLYDERSVNKAWERAILKATPKVFNKKTESYYYRIIEENKNKNYDFILIIKGEMITKSILRLLKGTFPNAKMCLYLYDSVNNVPGIKNKFCLFDSIASFDMKDCEKYSDLKFRPLFFADQFRLEEEKKKEEYQYDISFIGTIHSDRYLIIREVDEMAKKLNMTTYWYLYLQSKFMYHFYRITKKEFKGTSMDSFMFDKLSAESIADIVENSKIILDVQHPKQTGLTMRTIEMVGMNKKIITTNDSIKLYDFYNPTNIAVINRRKIEVPTSFFESDYRPIAKEIYEKYSLNNWVLEVLN